MSFGQIIKRLRRNADMTQEQLAEMLSISPQAVSRWETDAAMPDISLLRPLSNIFGVTADELLEIDVSRINLAVEAHKKAISEAYTCHDYKWMLELARSACREIPNNLELVGQLAFALTSGSNADDQNNIDDAISLYKMILEKSVDNLLRFRATAALCRLFAGKKNDKEQAMFYAKQLPKSHIHTSSYLMMQYDLIPDQEKNETYRFWIEQYARALADTVYQLADPNMRNSANELGVQERIALLEQSLSVFKIIYGEKLLSVNREFYEINRVIACMYLLEKQYDLALAKLEKAVEYAIAFDAYEENECYASLAMRGTSTDAHNLWDGTAVDDMLSRLKTQDRFNCIRENDRFVNVIKTLENCK